jgi:hypothetical protein
MKDQIKILIERLNKINESPYLHDTDLFHLETTVISKSAIERAYKHFGTLFTEIEIYEKNDGSAFVVGLIDDSGNLIHFLDIQLDSKSYPIEPTQLSSNYRQVGFVMISKNAAQQGITRAVYQYLVRHFDIVSDKVQYIGGKRLWLSLAKNNISNIYVFDGVTNDYIRNSSGDIINYNTLNIDEDFIWGKTTDHQKRILVASIMEKN